MEIALCLAFMAGIGALALVMNALHSIHTLLNKFIGTYAADRLADLMAQSQPPLADEKPQAVQVTIKPTAKTMTAWMDFEASQKAALDEFKD